MAASPLISVPSVPAIEPILAIPIRHTSCKWYRIFLRKTACTPTYEGRSWTEHAWTHALAESRDLCLEFHTDAKEIVSELSLMDLPVLTSKTIRDRAKARVLEYAKSEGFKFVVAPDDDDQEVGEWMVSAPPIQLYVVTYRAYYSSSYLLVWSDSIDTAVVCGEEAYKDRFTGSGATAQLWTPSVIVPITRALIDQHVKQKRADMIEYLKAKAKRIEETMSRYQQMIDDEKVKLAVILSDLKGCTP